MKLGKLQILHFNRMTRSELEVALADQQRQQSYIAFSSTKSGKDKKAELQARIDYIEERLRIVK